MFKALYECVSVTLEMGPVKIIKFLPSKHCQSDACCSTWWWACKDKTHTHSVTANQISVLQHLHTHGFPAMLWFTSHCFIGSTYFKFSSFDSLEFVTLMHSSLSNHSEHHQDTHTHTSPEVCPGLLPSKDTHSNAIIRLASWPQMATYSEDGSQHNLLGWCHENMPNSDLYNIIQICFLVLGRWFGD